MIYYFEKALDIPYEEAITKVTDELAKNGFGVLTEIDVKETLKIKIDVDFKKYKILGACNPKFAHKALSVEEKIGLMMPCNVIVYEAEEGKSVVAAVDPVASMNAVDNPDLEKVASEVREQLRDVIENL
jgi:uncharacterized protein (DUF302 family)